MARYIATVRRGREAIVILDTDEGPGICWLRIFCALADAEETTDFDLLEDGDAEAPDDPQ